MLLGEGKNKNATAEGPRREVVSLGDQSSVVVEWLDGNTMTNSDASTNVDLQNWIVLAVYPEVAVRKMQGVDALLSSVLRRYALYYDHNCKQTNQQKPQSWNMQLFVPPSDEFDSAFHSIIRRFQDQLGANASASTEKQRQTNKSNKQSTSTQNKGKEKRVWHDGKQKVTKDAMASLDMSKDKDDTAPSGQDGIREDARAIAEAKAAYMPTDDEVPAWEEEDEALDDFDITWITDKHDESEDEDDAQSPSGIRGFFSNLLSPNRPLTKADLEPPLKQMQQLLTSKNVAPSTAQAICEVVERQLQGKKVGTLVGVKRAVRHALEDAIERILRPELGGIGGRAGVKRGKSVDVLRGVVEKRERGSGMFGLGGSSAKRRPYVIVMIGINGMFI